MFCSKCGTENANGSKFCKECGDSFNVQIVGQQNSVPVPVSQASIQSKNDIENAQMLYMQAQLKMQQEALRLQQQQLREQQQANNAVAKCPKCGSTSLSGNKKGFGIGKAVIGAAIAGPIGLVAGNLGSKNVIVTCLKCGKKFKA